MVNLIIPINQINLKDLKYFIILVHFQFIIIYLNINCELNFILIMFYILMLIQFK